MKKLITLAVLIAIAGTVSAASLVTGGAFDVANVDDVTLKPANGEKNYWACNTATWSVSGGAAVLTPGGASSGSGTGIFVDNQVGVFSGASKLSFDYNVNVGSGGGALDIQLYLLDGSGAYDLCKVQRSNQDAPTSGGNYTVSEVVTESISATGSGTWTSTATFDMTGIEAFAIRFYNDGMTGASVSIDNVQIGSDTPAPVGGTVFIVK